MATDEFTTVALQLEDAFNRHDAAFYDAHPGLVSSKAFYQQLWAAFPDLRATAQTTIVADGWVAQVLSASGTMQGAFMGMAPTGKRGTYEVITMFRMADGKIVEYHAQADVMSMMQQLGLGLGAPSPAGA
jgi:predicted ester cyclase